MSKTDQLTPIVEGLATDYPARHWIDPHRHDAHQVIHAASGVFRVVSEAATWVVPPGRAIWMPAGREHAIRCHTDVNMRTVYIGPGNGALPADCRVLSVSPLMREILVRLATDPDPPARANLIAVLMSEIAVVETLPMTLPQPVTPALRQLSDRLMETPDDTTPLSDWARRLGLSERTLIRRFQTETGLTFRQWRRQVRLMSALERLAAGDAVTTVAYDIGYDSVSAFVAAFREVFGETPGRYVATRAGA